MHFGPFLSKQAVIVDKELVLNGGFNRTIIVYQFEIGDKLYIGRCLLPVKAFTKISRGENILISYSFPNPNFNVVGEPPPAPPVLLLTMFLVLVGISLIFLSPLPH